METFKTHKYISIPKLKGICKCEPHTFYTWEMDENKCSECFKRIFKEDKKQNKMKNRKRYVSIRVSEDDIKHIKELKKIYKENGSKLNVSNYVRTLLLNLPTDKKSFIKFHDFGVHISSSKPIKY